MIKKSFGEILRQQRTKNNWTQEYTAEKAGIGYRFLQEIEHGKKQPTKNNWTQEYTAEKAGIGYRFLQEIEHGKKQPTLNTLFKLAKALGITPDKLIMPIWKAWLEESNNKTKN